MKKEGFISPEIFIYFFILFKLKIFGEIVTTYEKTFFKTENEFSHIAVEVPTVTASLNASNTEGMVLKMS